MRRNVDHNLYGHFMGKERGEEEASNPEDVSEGIGEKNQNIRRRNNIPEIVKDKHVIWQMCI